MNKNAFYIILIIAFICSCAAHKPLPPEQSAIAEKEVRVYVEAYLEKQFHQLNLDAVTEFYASDGKIITGPYALSPAEWKTRRADGYVAYKRDGITFRAVITKISVYEGAAKVNFTLEQKSAKGTEAFDRLLDLEKRDGKWVIVKHYPA